MELPAYARFMDRLNPLVVAILRSRAHWLASAGLVLLTITGRRSGRVYSIPVGYHRFGDVIVVMVSGAAGRSWWRNFQTPRPLEVTLRGRRRPATAEVLRPPDPEFRQRVEQAFRRAAFVARIFSIDFDSESGLREDQVRALDDYAAVVKITLTEPGGPSC